MLLTALSHTYSVDLLLVRLTRITRTFRGGGWKEKYLAGVS